MIETIAGRRVAGFRAGACALAIVALAGCGGGGEAGTVNDHGTSTTQRMNCASACVESDTLSAGQMQAQFYLEDDGTRTQAEGGFFSGITIGYNVELHGDALYFVHGTVASQMGLPKASGGAAMADLGSPYLYDLPQRATAPLAGQFELHHAGQVYTSSTTLPAPFSIVSPTAGAVYSKASDAIPIQLDAARPEATWLVDAIDCRTSNNQSWVGGGAGWDPAFFTTDDGRSVQFHAATYMARLQQLFAQAGGTGTLTSCNLTLKASVTNGGTTADGLAAGSSISGLQLRKVKISVK